MKSRKLTLAAALKSRMGASKQVKHLEHWFASGAGRTPELDWGRSSEHLLSPTLVETDWVAGPEPGLTGPLEVLFQTQMLGGQNIKQAPPPYLFPTA